MLPPDKLGYTSRIGGPEDVLMIISSGLAFIFGALLALVSLGLGDAQGRRRRQVGGVLHAGSLAVPRRTPAERDNVMQRSRCGWDNANELRGGAGVGARPGPTKQWSGREQSWRFVPAAHR
jgi:hypothetical protein